MQYWAKIDTYAGDKVVQDAGGKYVEVLINGEWQTVKRTKVRKLNEDTIEVKVKE